MYAAKTFNSKASRQSLISFSVATLALGTVIGLSTSSIANAYEGVEIRSRNGVASLPARLAGTAGGGEYIRKCLSCHGPNGVSGWNSFPNLAGQNVDYLERQLKWFRDGGRKDFTLDAMPYMVTGLSDVQLKSLAETFSVMRPEQVSKTEMTVADLAAYEVGRELINGTATTCRFCHLSNPTGDAPLSPEFPMLVGQQKGYLVSQIKGFRDKRRWTPVMNDLTVGALTDEQVEAIATYLRYLRAR